MLLGARRRRGPDTSPVKLPPDALTERLGQVAEFDDLVSAVDSFRAAILVAADQFAAAPAALVEHLNKVCTPGNPWSGLVPKLTTHLSTCAARLQSGTRHVEAVKYLIEQCRAQSAEVRSAFAAREAAWAPKVHCDEQVLAMRKRFGPSFLLKEKRARLSAKTSADQEFEKCTETASLAVDDLLSRKWATTGAMLWELCRYYVEVFQDAQQMFQDFSDLANLVVPPVRTESLLAERDMVRSSAGDEASASGMESGRWGRRGHPPRPQPASLAEPAPLPPLGKPLCSSSDVASTSSAEPSLHDCREQNLSRGDKVLVWSASSMAWLDGVIEDIYTASGVTNGYMVPVGAVKVSHRSGLKFIRPEHVNTVLRKKCEAPASLRGIQTPPPAPS